MKKMGKFVKNHDRSLQKAHANIPLNNLTTNTNASPAEVKNLSFPTPGVVGCKIPTYQKKIIKKESTQGGHMEKTSYKVSVNVSLYNLTKNTNVSNKKLK